MKGGELSVTPLPISGRAYVCHICDARYIHKRHLGDHLKQHQGQTRCPLCQKEFAFRYTMRRHMLVLHNMTQEQVNLMTKSNTATAAPAELEHLVANVAEEN